MKINVSEFMEPEALETCYIKCERQALDFVFFDADILNKEKHKNISLNYQRKDCTNPELVYQGPYILKLLIDHKAYSPSPCLNFIRREYLTEIQLDFLPGIIMKINYSHACYIYRPKEYPPYTRISSNVGYGKTQS